MKAVYIKVESEDGMACVKIPLTGDIYAKKQAAMDLLSKNHEAKEISFKVEGAKWFPESFAASVSGRSESIVFRRGIAFITANTRHNNDPISTVNFDIGSETKSPDRQIWVDVDDDEASDQSISDMLIEAGEM